MNMSRFLTILLLVVSFVALSPDAAAQKSGNKYRPFPAYGFKFKPLKNWDDVPVDGNLSSAGVIAQLSSQKGAIVVTPEKARLKYSVGLKVLKVDPPKATTEGKASSGSGSLRGGFDKGKAAEKGGKDHVATFFRGSLRMDEFKLVVPEVSEFKISKGLVAKHEEIKSFLVTTDGAIDVMFDVYTLQLPDYQIVFLWDYPASDKKDVKKWSKVIEKSMKSFRLELDSIETTNIRSVDSDSDYEDLLEFHRNEVAQTPGWDLIETPSKQYLIKTNSKDRKDLKNVIKRLEASRKIYEQDFPPAKPITQISVVRICATQDDFKIYGKTSDGVAGFFNPSSEELVLYFPQGSADLTMAVMTHEGFHQYCHFLFNRSEAHRWFDEGHGDYYGAFKMRGSKLVPNDDMKGSLARTPLIKTMLREGSAAPLSRHIRFNHKEWQSQDPSRNTACYSQSFSIIYFLREGTRGKVSSKYWKKEYAEIIPNYIKYLSQGFSEAYAEITKDAQEAVVALQEAQADPKMIEIAKRRAEKPWNYLPVQVHSEIWAKAMAESWGKIDEVEFEERWTQYVLKEM
jgi:hypothetical protein